jgi:hypothetical protein
MMQVLCIPLTFSNNCNVNDIGRISWALKHFIEQTIGLHNTRHSGMQISGKRVTEV